MVTRYLALAHILKRCVDSETRRNGYSERLFTITSLFPLGIFSSSLICTYTPGIHPQKRFMGRDLNLARTVVLRLVLRIKRYGVDSSTSQAKCALWREERKGHYKMYLYDWQDYLSNCCNHYEIMFLANQSTFEHCGQY